MVVPSPLRPWQEQIVQHIKTGRLRYLQRIAVVCAALEPRHHTDRTTSQKEPPIFPSAPSSLSTQDYVVQKHGRIYIPNPFLLPTLHNCVACVRRRSLTIKRILSGMYITIMRLL